MRSIIIWSLVVAFVASAEAQITCSNGVIIYEKSSATSVRLDSRADRTIEIATSEVPTTTCQRVCDGTPSCTAFSVDYTARTCKVFSVPIQKSRLLSRPDSAFFEKTCIPDMPQSRFRTKCAGRLWAVERVRGTTFDGPVVRAVENVATREVCTRLCLTEATFNCASATYDEITRLCSLSTEDRHTMPTAVSEKSRTTDYMENQCLTDLQDCQFLPQSSFKVLSVDYVTVARNEEQCRDDCTTNTAIVCRSYSYELAQNACSLSSDDSISLEGVEIPREDGYRYAERRCRHSNSRLTVGALLRPQSNQFALSNNGVFDTSFMSTDPSGTSFAFGQNFPGSGHGFRGVVAPGQNGFMGNANQFGFNSQQSPGQFSGAGFGFINPNVRGFGPTGGVANRGGFQDPNNPFLANQGGFPERCTFEKASGLAVIADPHSTIPANSFSRGVTPQCSTFCRLQGHTNCPAFVLDYNTNQCNILSRPADVALAPGTVHGQSYFEQVCFSDFHRSCEGKAWAFERIVGSELRGFDDRKLPNVVSRRDCEESCLKETQFLCMSAEYDSSRSECRLSRESRVSRSYAFQQSPETDYLENQCVPPTTQSSCTPMRQDGLNLVYVDASVSQVFTEDECRRTCQTYTNFSCNAAAFRQATRECFLSGDLTVVAEPDSILLHSSCLQPIQIATPLLSPNFGQMFGSNGGTQVPGGFNGGFNGIQNTNQNGFPPGRDPNFNSQSGTGTIRPTTQDPNNQSFGNPTLFGNEQFFPQIPGQTFSSNGIVPNSHNFNTAGNQQFGTSGQQFGTFGQTFGQPGQQAFGGTNQVFGNTNPQFGQQFPGTGHQFITPGQTQFVGSGRQPFSNGQQFAGSGGQSDPFGQHFSGSTGQGQLFGNGQQFIGQQGGHPFGNGQQFIGQQGQRHPFGSGQHFAGSQGQGQPFGNGQQFIGSQGQLFGNGQQFAGAQGQSFGNSQPFGADGGQTFGTPGQQFGTGGQQFGTGGQQFGSGNGQQFGSGNGQQFGSGNGQQFGSGHGQQFGSVGTNQFSPVDDQNFGQRLPLERPTRFPFGRSGGDAEKVTSSERSSNLKRLTSSPRPRAGVERIRSSTAASQQGHAEKLTRNNDPANEDLE